MSKARRGETQDSEIAVRECEAMEQRVIVRLESGQGTCLDNQPKKLEETLKRS